jgi:hypothetical protein
MGHEATCSLVYTVGDGVSGCVNDVGEDAWSDSCNGGSVGQRGSSVGQRGGCSRRVSNDLTPHAVNHGGAGNWHGGPHGQGVAGHTVPQGVRDVVSPEHVTFWAQVAEASDLVASRVL